MRFISSKVHGMMDYLFGILLMASPWLFGFSDVASARWVALVFGAMPILMALMTRFELGVWRLIPLRVHLMIDMVAGVVLLLSPWFFGFSELVAAPFVVFGLIEIITPLLTERYANVPEEDRHEHHTATTTTSATSNYTPVYNNLRH